MKKRQGWKIVIIVGVVLLSLWGIYPTLRLLALSPQQREEMEFSRLMAMEEEALKLGLDLQGGMHLVLEVDKSDLPEKEAKDALDRALEIIRNRIDQFGVSEPLIQKQGQDRIIVELPGLQDEKRAKELIGRTALLEFKLLRNPEEVRDLFNAIDSLIAGQADTLGEEAETEVEISPEEELSPEELFARTEEDSLAPTVPQTPAERPFTSLLVSLGSDIAVPEAHISRVQRYLKMDEVKRQIPNGMQIAWRAEQDLYRGEYYRRLFFLNEKPELTGATLTDARVIIGGGDDIQTANKPLVTLRFTREGAKTFSQVTGANIDRQLAIVLDGSVYSAPVIRDKIRDGRAQIEGIDQMEEATDLSIVLRAGALPAPVEVIEERTVGPTLGKDSIDAGMKAATIGMILVVLFMLVYYRMAGLIAVLALFLDILFIMAALARLGATLTLPGIAGIILTIGMAVDANVLIFERIREELRTGKTVRTAIDSGYSRAFRAILDSNLTTLLTAIVLYQFGTGPIKGFAVTLSLGIIASMFTAVVVTRVIFDLITAQWKPARQLSI